MPEKPTEFDAAEYIETVEDARQHLELCAEQDPGDGSAIRAARNTIARAQNMSGLARDAELNRAGLYRALSEDGNPTLSTLLKITRALGLRLRIAAYTGIFTQQRERSASPSYDSNAIIFVCWAGLFRLTALRPGNRMVRDSPPG